MANNTRDAQLQILKLCIHRLTGISGHPYAIREQYSEQQIEQEPIEEYEQAHDSQDPIEDSDPQDPIEEYEQAPDSQDPIEECIQEYEQVEQIPKTYLTLPSQENEQSQQHHHLQNTLNPQKVQQIERSEDTLFKTSFDELDLTNHLKIEVKKTIGLTDYIMSFFLILLVWNIYSFLLETSSGNL